MPILGDGRHPDLLQRPGELHAGRPLSARRDRRAARPVRRLRLQLDRHPELGRRRQGAGGMDPRPPPADGPVRRRRAPRCMPFQSNRTLPARPHHRDARPALRHALALSAVRDRARCAPLALPRPAGGGGCRHGRDGRLGAAELVRAVRASRPSTTTPGAGRTGSSTRPPSAGRCATRWPCSTSRASPSSWSRARTPARC